MVYVTRGLLDVLLDEARDREPESVTIELGVTPAKRFDELDLPPETSVFTHLYLPGAGRSIEAVFGVKLGTPSGRTPGLFVSHPGGSLGLDRTDDLREVVLVAVPPWDRDSIAAFGRNGRRRRLRLVEADVPRESLP